MKPKNMICLWFDDEAKRAFVAMSIFVIGIIASKARFASLSNQRQIVFFGVICVCSLGLVSVTVRWRRRAHEILPPCD